MLVFFSPLVFFVFISYFLLSMSFFFISDYFYFWIFMEVFSLLFTGAGLMIFSFSNSVLMIYFLVQSVSSFFILLAFVGAYHGVFMCFLLMKLALFPFYFWFMGTVVFFPTVLLFGASSMQKLPIMLFLSFFFPLDSYSKALWFFFVFSLLASGALMLFSLSWRFLICSSSIGTNVWMILSQMAGVDMFIIFFILYSISLLSFVAVADFSYVTGSSFLNLCSFVFMVNISGMPPLIVFYPKVLIVLSLTALGTPLWVVMVVLFFTVIMIVGYLKFSMNYVVKKFGCSSLFFVF